ncbi:TetR/AcrR family transcriptional regulator [Streptomyces apricus]|uniref:TetR/AcrR family transcriptional regulator n=1 Tax=Streptomyces apricus TaxID=1828112 RepID=A0A5B0AVF6_9ACTN|nr:TetR/AcrR family transcriptional regulator [Streptomyces apricus]KAA0933704.1 TetR/AcrR family transcriptional regulator [Streptomyces apricus]
MVRAAGRAGRPARTSVWLAGRAPRGGRARGDRPPPLDRDRITAVAAALLDAEGPAGFSMRRLAAELNVTAMSVYWYVDTKDDLLELALDAVYGELELPDPDADDDWRDQLRALASGYRALLLRHPWVSPLAGTFPDIGPRSVAFSQAVQRVVRRTGLPPHRLAGAVSAVLRFVYGSGGPVEGRLTRRPAGAGTDPDASPGQAPGTVEEMRERDFHAALDLVIAGIETVVLRGEP